MDIPVDLLQEAADHRKSCDTCSKSHVCDEAAKINMKLLEASFS